MTANYPISVVKAAETGHSFGTTAPDLHTFLTRINEIRARFAELEEAV